MIFGKIYSYTNEHVTYDFRRHAELVHPDFNKRVRNLYI